jgi:hypothetical protein
MSDTLIPPEKDKTPPSYATEPGHHVDYAELPPGITFKPDEIVVKHPFFMTSVIVMVFTSLLTFWMPFFNGLLGGALGGFLAGRMNRAVAAAVVTSVMVPAILAFAHLMSLQPGLRFLSGLTPMTWFVCHVAGTFLGAVSGAFAGPRRYVRELYGRTV